MKVSDLLDELLRLCDADETVLDLRVTLAGLEYNATDVQIRPNWQGTATVLDIT